MTERSWMDEPTACAAPWLKSAWVRRTNVNDDGELHNKTYHRACLLYFLTWDPETQRWSQSLHWSRSWWACEEIQPHVCRTWKRFHHPASSLPSLPSQSLLWWFPANLPLNKKWWKTRDTIRPLYKTTFHAWYFKVCVSDRKKGYCMLSYDFTGSSKIYCS